MLDEYPFPVHTSPAYIPYSGIGMNQILDWKDTLSTFPT